MDIHSAIFSRKILKYFSYKTLGEFQEVAIGKLLIKSFEKIIKQFYGKFLFGTMDESLKRFLREFQDELLENFLEDSNENFPKKNIYELFDKKKHLEENFNRNPMLNFLRNNLIDLSENLW